MIDAGLERDGVESNGHCRCRCSAVQVQCSAVQVHRCSLLEGKAERCGEEVYRRWMSNVR
jgi:hypothetical protein